MFNRREEQEPQMPPPQEIPELAEFEVETYRFNADGPDEYKWVKIQGHGVQVTQSGALYVIRAIFIDEECRQPGPITTHVFAPGEWRRVKTNYEGYKPKSELAIH